MIMETKETVAMVLSIAAMLVTVVSFQAKRKQILLFLQTGGTLLYLVSYFFSEGGIAVALNVVYLVRNVLFMLFGDREKRKLRIMAGTLCSVYLMIYAVYAIWLVENTVTMLWYILPVAGALLGTCAVACKNVNFLRAWKMGDSACWLAYNIHIGMGALGGIVGEVLNLLSQTIGILRYRTRSQSLRSDDRSINKNEDDHHAEGS